MVTYLWDHRTLSGFDWCAVRYMFDISSTEFISWNAPLWFLLVLFCINILVFAIRKTKYSKPIHNLIDNMQGFFMLEDREIHKTENISEYEYLEKGVHALLDDYQSLNAMLQEKTVKERRNFLTLLMNGEFDTELNIIEEAAPPD